MCLTVYQKLFIAIAVLGCLTTQSQAATQETRRISSNYVRPRQQIHFTKRLSTSAMATWWVFISISKIFTVTLDSALWFALLIPSRHATKP